MSAVTRLGLIDNPVSCASRVVSVASVKIENVVREALPRREGENRKQLEKSVGFPGGRRPRATSGSEPGHVVHEPPDHLQSSTTSFRR